MNIYHIVTPEVWGKFKDEKFYAAESLETENFIHCSFENQIEAVLQRYYKNAKTIFILEIEPEKLRSKYVEEPSTGGEIYPHIYGEINADAIVGIEERKIERS